MMRRWVVVLAVATSMRLGLAAGAVDPHATVAQGVLTGTTDNGVTVFRGVPFAAPPVGDLRWAPPRPPERWGSQPREAKTFGAACTQTLRSSGAGQWTSEYMSPEAPGVSEDCLFLNIWTPATLTGSARPPASLPSCSGSTAAASTKGPALCRCTTAQTSRRKASSSSTSITVWAA